MSNQTRKVMSKEKYDLFVSYSRVDLKEVVRLVDQLASRIPGLNYWFDITGVESASEFEEKIISAINNSEFVLFAVSENSMKSDWSKDEVTYAKNIGKKVIPVLLKGTSMKEGWLLFKFGRVDCIDSTDQIQMEKLISDLSRWIEKPAELKSECLELPLITRAVNFFKARILLIISSIISVVLALVLTLSFLFKTDPPIDMEPLQEEDSTLVVVEETSDTVSITTAISIDPVEEKSPVTSPVQSVIPAQSAPSASRIQKTSEQKPVAHEPRGTYVNGFQYVDLGLSVKWASHNVGARTPSSYGQYFAWGEISPKKEYTDSNSVTFNHAVGDIAGDPSYDAARALWGSPWRMPTRNEMKELLSKCTWTVVTQDGHNCFKVVGPNGNCIYMPVAGHYISSSLEKLGEAGHYMTSNVPAGNKHRMYGLCLKTESRQYFMHIWLRSVGQSIRPVCE